MSGVLNVLLAPTAAAAGGSSTWNPADTGANITFSNGNLTASKASGNSSWTTVRGTASNNSGKKYFEITATTGTQYFEFGAAAAGGSLADHLGALGVTSFGEDVRSGIEQQETTFAPAGLGLGVWPGFTSGQTVGFAVDLDGGKVWVAPNGTYTWYNAASDPAAGTIQPWNFTANTALFPGCSLFGSDSVAATLTTTAPFAFTVPTGFSAWG